MNWILPVPLLLVPGLVVLVPLAPLLHRPVSGRRLARGLRPHTPGHRSGPAGVVGILVGRATLVNSSDRPVVAPKLAGSVAPVGVAIDEGGLPALLTVTEAAQLVGFPHWIVRNWIRRGHLRTVRIDGRLRIRPVDLVAAQALVHVGTVVPAWRQDPRRAGWRLRVLRETARLTQLQLAAESGVTHELISRLELGQRAPLAATVHKLARALGVEPERFVSRESIGLTTLTVAEAAARLGVPAGRVQTWLREGTLPGTKVSGQ